MNDLQAPLRRRHDITHLARHPRILGLTLRIFCEHSFDCKGNWPAYFLAPIAGSWILDALDVKRGNYTNLPWALLIRTIIRLLPMAFVPLLVPTGSSADKTRFDAADLAEGETPSRSDEEEGLTPPHSEIGMTER